MILLKFKTELMTLLSSHFVYLYMYIIVTYENISKKYKNHYVLTYPFYSLNIDDEYEITSFWKHKSS